MSCYVAPLRDSVANATRLVDYLRRQGGTAVATNLIAYCEDTIADGVLVPGDQEACINGALGAPQENCVTFSLPWGHFG